ncbi:MAG: hypothetical protein ACOC7W_07995, partial [Desulfosalsimonas sp.]
MKKFFRADIKTAFAAGIILAVISHAAAVHAANPGPESKTVLAFGSSEGTDDSSGARKKAVSSALLSAVRTAASGLLTEAALRQNFEALAEIIDEKTDDFIQDYR